MGRDVSRRCTVQDSDPVFLELQPSHQNATPRPAFPTLHCVHSRLVFPSAYEVRSGTRSAPDIDKYLFEAPTDYAELRARTYGEFEPDHMGAKFGYKI